MYKDCRYIALNALSIDCRYIVFDHYIIAIIVAAVDRYTPDYA